MTTAAPVSWRALSIEAAQVALGCMLVAVLLWLTVPALGRYGYLNNLVHSEAIGLTAWGLLGVLLRRTRFYTIQPRWLMAPPLALGGIIAYANEVKTERLGVDAGIIEEHGAVSEECALAMASGCRNLFGSDYALSITGIAGPEGGTEDKPVGTVYVGLSSAHHNLARRFNLGSTREINRTRSVYCALELLRRAILDLL